MKYILFFLIMLLSSSSIAETILSNTISDADVKRINSLCYKPPSGLYKETVSTTKKRGNLTVDVDILRKILVSMGVGADLSGGDEKSEKIIKGFQRVLIEHQLEDNKNFRECSSNLIKLLIESGSESNRDDVPSGKNISGDELSGIFHIGRNIAPYVRFLSALCVDVKSGERDIEKFDSDLDHSIKNIAKNIGLAPHESNLSATYPGIEMWDHYMNQLTHPISKGALMLGLHASYMFHYLYRHHGSAKIEGADLTKLQNSMGALTEHGIELLPFLQSGINKKNANRIKKCSYDGFQIARNRVIAGLRLLGLEQAVSFVPKLSSSSSHSSFSDFWQQIAGVIIKNYGASDNFMLRIQ